MARHSTTRPDATSKPDPGSGTVLTSSSSLEDDVTPRPATLTRTELGVKDKPVGLKVLSAPTLTPRMSGALEKVKTYPLNEPEPASSEAS